MPWKRKDAKNAVIKSGIYAHFNRMKIDGRTKVGKYLTLARQGLEELFTNSPDVAAQFLITRVLYKALRLQFFELKIIKGGSDSLESYNETDNYYVTLSNSFRKDLESLIKMSANEVATPEDLERHLKNTYQTTCKPMPDDKSVK